MAHPVLLTILLGGCLLLPATFAQGTHTSANRVGVRYPPTPDDIARAARYWDEVCNHDEGGGGYSGKEGNDQVFCAYFSDTIPITVTHKPIPLKEARSSTGGDQYIVIDPPFHKYTHKIKVTGNRAAGPKTTIYVRPPKNFHLIDLDDKTTGNTAAKKPTVVYLKPSKTQDGDGVASSTVSAPAGNTGVTPTPVHLRSAPYSAYSGYSYDHDESNLSPVQVEAETEVEAETAPQPLVVQTEVSEQVSEPVADNVQSDIQSQTNSGNEYEAKFTPGVFKLGSGARMQYTV